jgi:hypothetical protein
MGVASSRYLSWGLEVLSWSGSLFETSRRTTTQRTIHCRSPVSLCKLVVGAYASFLPAGVPSNKRADSLAGKAAEKTAWPATTSLAHLKLKICEKFRKAKEEWHRNPAHHGVDEIPPPPPKKSNLDRAKNALARTAAQIRTGRHWRSAVYLKRIRKRQDDKCWFCTGPAQMSRFHVLPVPRREAGGC